MITITRLRFRLTALQESGFYEVFAHHMAPPEQHSNGEGQHSSL